MPKRSKALTTLPPENRSYSRSWKNLLINKRYQLRLSLFMAALAGVLTFILGYYVMRYVDNTTLVGINRIFMESCPDRPVIEPKPSATSRASAAGGSAGSGDQDVGDGKVVIEFSSIQTCDDPDPKNRPENCPAYVPPAPPMAPPDFVSRVSAHWSCELRQAGAVRELYDGRSDILLVFIGSGFLLVIGLAFYGIKMTHKVAGPLYKVERYLTRMRDGRLDTVYSLRKGDQLTEFYAHFKAAHAGMVAMERADIVRLRALVLAIDKAKLEVGSPEMAEHVAALRKMLARKERSLE